LLFRPTHCARPADGLTSGALLYIYLYVPWFSTGCIYNTRYRIICLGSQQGFDIIGR